jgi:hypothetical protein
VQDQTANMAVDEKSFADSHETTRITCQSNTQISSKATNIISTLSKAKDSENAKPALVIIVAQSRWVNKLISIVEIAKRDLESKGVKVFQYNALSSEIVEIERKPKSKGVGAAAHDGDASEDEAFQTMGAAEEGGMKKRAVPIMTTYLATQPVKALRMEFG